MKDLKNIKEIMKRCLCIAVLLGMAAISGYAAGYKTKEDVAKEFGEHTLAHPAGPFKHIGRWTSFFMMYSGYRPTETFNLERLLGSIGADLVGEVAFNADLIMAMDEFQRRHFVTIYPVPVYNVNTGAIDRLNEVSYQWHEPRNAPFVNLFVYLDTVSAETFKISLMFHMPADTLEMAQVNSLMNQSLQRKTFTKMGETLEPVNEAIRAGLDALSGKIGQAYLPDFFISYRDKRYSHGQVVEVWQGDGRVEFEALKRVDGRYESVYSGWHGEYIVANGAFAWYDALEPGLFPILATHDGDSLHLDVRVKPGTGVPNLRDALKMLVIEALREKNQGVTEELIALRKDSAENIEKRSQIANSYNSSIDYAAYARSGNGNYAESAGLAVNRDVYFLNKSEIEKIKSDKNIDVYCESSADFFSALHKMNRQILIREFLIAMIDDPVRLDLFIDSLLKNSGRLIARFSLSALNAEEKKEVKQIITEYINQQIVDSIQY